MVAPGPATGPGSAAAAVRGRPRRYPAAAERQLLLDAATSVLRRNGGRTATLQEILDECGLSTRSLYRHFPSKAELLLAIQLRDAERAAERMSVRMSASGNAWAAIRTWIDEMAGTLFDRRRAARIELLARGIAEADGTPEQNGERLAAIMLAPLEQALRQGRADGVLVTADPAVDAATVFAICVDTLRRCRSGTFPFDRRQAVEHVLRFARSALTP